MKKRAIVVIALLVCCIGMMIMAGCNPLEEGASGWEGWAERYAETAEAKSIEQKIEITRGEEKVYTLEKTLTKTAEGYDVTEKENRLASIDVDEIPEGQYGEQIKEYKLEAAAEAITTLALKEEYFNASGLVIAESSLKGQIKDANVKDFLAIKDALPAEVKSLNVELSSNKTAVTKIKLKYASKGNEVNIEITYTY